MKTLGENIKKLRKAKGWTLAKMSEMLGYTSTAICTWERGQKVPSLLNAIDLADLFGITLDELVGR